MIAGGGAYRVQGAALGKESQDGEVGEERGGTSGGAVLGEGGKCAQSAVDVGQALGGGFRVGGDGSSRVGGGGRAQRTGRRGGREHKSEHSG